jgi:hypothetical protein
MAPAAPESHKDTAKLLAVMDTLKGAFLDFYTDSALIASTVDRARASPLKVFCSAAQNMERSMRSIHQSRGGGGDTQTDVSVIPTLSPSDSVIEMPSEGHLRRLVLKLVDEDRVGATALLTQLKVLVISFDCLNPIERRLEGHERLRSIISDNESLWVTLYDSLLRSLDAPPS